MTCKVCANVFFVLAFCAVPFTVSSGAVERTLNTAPSNPSTHQADVTSIDGIVKALYESITFKQGEEPEMDRLQSLFSPKAQFVRMDQGDAIIMDVKTFVSSFEARVKIGALRSFYEGEISRKTHTYERIAQVFSVYKKVMNSESAREGVNCIQLYYDDERWWISSILWQDKSADI